MSLITWERIKLKQAKELIKTIHKSLLLFTGLLVLLVCIALTILGKMVTETAWRVEQNIKNSNWITEQTIKTATETKVLKQRIEDYETKLIIDKRERLYEDLQIYISGYYGKWNTQKDKKQLNKIIKSCLESCEEAWAIVDIDVKHCWVGNKIKYKYAERKGRFIYYCKTKKELACLMLATAKAETNFTEDIICQNYERDKNGLYITIYGWKIKKKAGYEYALKKTTKDYGCYQINENNFSDLIVLRMLNLWTPERNEWIRHLRTNCLLRIVNYKFRNDEKRAKKYVYDLNLYNQLMKLNWGEYE